MLSYSIRFSAPSFWMGGGLDSRCGTRRHSGPPFHIISQTGKTTISSYLKRNHCQFVLYERMPLSINLPQSRIYART